MIPKIIHRVHLGPNEPQTVKDSWQLSKTINKGWQHLTHNETSLENFPICRDYLDLSDKYAFKSDLMRIEAIYNWGGAYIDTDVFCIKPFDDLTQHDKIVVAFEGYDVIGSAVILAPPKNEKVFNLLNEMITIVKKEYVGDFKYGSHSEAFSPRIFTNFWKNDNDVIKLSPESFYPILWSDDHKVLNRDLESVDDYLSRISSSITEQTYCSHKAVASWYN